MNAFEEFAQSETQPNAFEEFASQSEKQKEDSLTSQIGEAFKQVTLGTAKKFTWPADMLKAMSKAQAYDDLRESEAAGEEIDPDAYRQAIEQAGEFIPTQEGLEKKLEEVTGLSLRPKDKMGEFFRTTGELGSLTPGNLGRRAVAAPLGAGAETGLEAAGVPKPIAATVGAVTTAAASRGRVAPKSVSPEAQQMRDTAGKFELRKFAGAEKEGVKPTRATISEKKEATLRKEIGTDIQNAVKKVVEGKVPVAKQLRDLGYDLKDAYKTAFSRAREIAKDSRQLVRTRAIERYIEKTTSKIAASAPSPSTADEAVLKILERERKVAAGPITKEQALNQYQNFNANTAAIYRKPEWAGAEARVAETYRELKQALLQEVERTGDKALSDTFNFGNKIFHEAEKLKKVEKILEPAFKDGYNSKKLEQILANDRKIGFLTRDLGPEAVKDLKEISKYGEMVEKRVFDRLRIAKPKDAADYVRQFGVIGAPLIFAAKQLAIPVTIANRIRGELFVRDATRKTYKDFLKAAAGGNEAAIKLAASRLDASIEKEYGSINEFFDKVGSSYEDEFIDTLPSPGNQGPGE